MNTLVARGKLREQTSVLATNTVLRNTYWLLSITLLFSVLAAGISMAMSLPHPGVLLTLVGCFGLLFLTTNFRDSAVALLFVFALTGVLGYTLGLILNAYLALPNGSQIVMMAVAFLSLSAFSMTTRKNFSFISRFLAVGILVAFLASPGAVFVEIPGLALAVASLFVLLRGGLILYQTSETHSRWRNQLHHGRGHAVCIDFRPFYQLAALTELLPWGRTSTLAQAAAEFEKRRAPLNLMRAHRLPNVGHWMAFSAAVIGRKMPPVFC